MHYKIVLITNFDLEEGKSNYRGLMVSIAFDVFRVKCIEKGFSINKYAWR